GIRFAAELRDDREERHEDRPHDRECRDDRHLGALEPLVGLLAHRCAEAEERRGSTSRRAALEGHGPGGHAATSLRSMRRRKTVSRSSVSAALAMSARPWSPATGVTA